MNVLKPITVVIPTYNHPGRFNDLVKLIDSLSLEPNAKYVQEIIIVDNGISIDSKDRKQIINTDSVTIRFVNERCVGLSYARNIGIKNATTDIVAFLDDDVWVSETWAEGIVNGHVDKSVLAVGGPVVAQNSSILKETPWLTDYFLRFILPPSFPIESGKIKAPFYLIGANMSFKSEVFKEFGVFDINLGRKGRNLLSNEDTEFFLRIPEPFIRFESGAVVFCLISKNKTTKAYMIRRFFWQGISDRLMLKRIDPLRFYDNDEVVFGLKLMKNYINKIYNFKFFESLCFLIRIFGFKVGVLFTKKQKG